MDGDVEYKLLFLKSITSDIDSELRYLIYKVVNLNEYTEKDLEFKKNMVDFVLKQIEIQTDHDYLTWKRKEIIKNI